VCEQQARARGGRFAVRDGGQDSFDEERVGLSQQARAEGREFALVAMARETGGRASAQGEIDERFV
jgi:hypothetical protein